MCPALSSLYSSWRDYSWSPLHPQKWPSLEDTLYRHLDPGHSSAAGVSLRQHLPPHCSPGQLPVCPTKVPARPRCYPQALPGRSSLGSSLFWINISTIGIHSGFLGLPLFFSQILLMIVNVIGRAGTLNLFQKLLSVLQNYLFCSSIQSSSFLTSCNF